MKIRTPVILTVLSLFFLFPLKWFNPLAHFGESVSFAVGNLAFMWILAAVSAIIVFCSMIARGTRIRVNTQKNFTMGLVMLIAGAALIWDGVVAFLAYSSTGIITAGQESTIISSLSIVQQAIAETFGINLPSGLISSALFFNRRFGIYYCIASALGGLGFLLMSHDFFGGRNFFRNKPLLAILPTIWGVARIVLSYMVYTSVADLTLYALDILFMCSTLIFMFAQARLFADIKAEKSVRTAVASGLCSIIFCVCSNGIRYAQIMSGRGMYCIDFNTPRFVDSIITVMIAAYIIYIIAPRARTPISADDVYKNTTIIPPQERSRTISKIPTLFLHDEEPETQNVSQTVYPNDAHRSDNFVKAVPEDYIYGDVDDQYSGLFLPVKMNGQNSRKMNLHPKKRRKVYRVQQKSPFAPNVHINTRLR